MKLHKIETGNFKLDGGAMFGIVPKVMWSKLYPSDENNLCNWAMRCLLVEDEDRLILIDTGIGTKQNHKFLRHYYLNGDDTLEKSIKAAGFTFEDVTDVVITHLHFDHVGGAVSRTENGELKPTFPNATYHVSKSHWAWATEPNRRERASFLHDNIMPLKESGQLNILDVTDRTDLFPNFEIRIFNGHTDGQIIPIINYHGKKVVYMGDLIPSAAHIPMPYIVGYDTKPLVTLEDKARLYIEAIEDEFILFFEHDIYNECCTLHDTEKGVKVKDVFNLASIL